MCSEGIFDERAVVGVAEGNFSCVMVGFSVGNGEGSSKGGSEAEGGRYLRSRIGGAAAGASEKLGERLEVIHSSSSVKLLRGVSGRNSL